MSFKSGFESRERVAGGREFQVRGAAVLNDRLANDVRRSGFCDNKFDFALFLLPFFVPFLTSQCPTENAETKTKYIFLVYVSIDLYHARTASSFLMHERFKHRPNAILAELTRHATFETT